MEERFGKLHEHGEGHHEFGFILPMIAIPLTIGFMMRMARRKYRYMNGAHRGDWENGVPPMFAELHRRAHAAEQQKAAGEEKTQ
jgi:hypothetical protein